MALATAEDLIARNPATGEELGRVAVTPPEAVGEAVARAREAQRHWRAVPWRGRREVLRRWWRILAGEADSWAGSIAAEVGKPRTEAMAADVIATLDLLRWTVKNAGHVLADHRIGPGWQRWLMIPGGRLHWQPFGVVGMLGTWNYPLLLNAPPIAHALAAGNAVVWKPSELAPRTGLRLQRSLDAAGFPEGLVSAVFGGPEVGRALVAAEIDKAVFTGGIDTGRAVLGALGRRGVPAVAELSGFDPAIVLPDAPFEATARALTWSAFVGAGQTCVAVKRVYVVGDPAPWYTALAEQARTLRLGDPAHENVDLGPLISESARDRFDAFVQAAVAAGARIITGGTPSPGPGWFYPPTVLAADTPAAESALAGVFGPVVLVRGFADVDEAIAAANASPYGLTASLWTRDLTRARTLAARLDPGMVFINEAVTPVGHAAAPFGGTKASGFGRIHGAMGLQEFAQTQVVYRRRPGGFRPQLFPYSAWVLRVLAVYRRLFHPGPP